MFKNRKYPFAHFVLVLTLLGGLSNAMPTKARAAVNASAESEILLANQAPVVSVGVDQAVTLGDRVFLRGVVSDDNLPNSGAIPSVTWSKVSGPGTVSFGHQKDFLTWATFSTTDSYVLRLTVNDGQLSNNDELNVVVNSSPAHTLRVPQDYATIQGAINAAQNGDLVLVSPGTYAENLSFGKTITLASTFYTTGNQSAIDQTVISSPTILSPVVLVTSAAGPATRIVGFTIQNGDDGIKIRGNASVLNNKFFTQQADGVDFAGGAAGMVLNNHCANNGDDCVDIDDADVLVESNQMVANGEGVEIRTSNHIGTQLTIILRNNIITGSSKTGLQLIDIDTVADTAAFLLIERNLIANNAQSGLSLMDNKITTDDYRAASLRERIHLFNNTFVGNYYGAHGGDNLIAVNNIFANHAGIAVKQIDGNSVLSHNLFWNNGTDNLGSNLVLGTTLFADPRLDGAYKLQAGSPAIDAGVASFTLTSGETVLSIPAADYSGAAPDLGAYESSFTVGPTLTPIVTPTNTPVPTATPVSIKPPVAANLTSPSGNISTAKPTYTWNAVLTSAQGEAATYYYLWINGPSENVFKRWYEASAVCSGGTCSVTPEVKLPQGTHTWWIQTWNGGGYGPWSDGMTFTPTLPGATALVSPSGNIGADYIPTYTWNKVSGTDWYYLWVNGPSGNVIKQWYDGANVCGASTCAATPSKTLAGGDHLFWVQTWNSVGFGPWSSSLSFSTVPLGAATLVSPSGTITNSIPTYTWNKVSGADWYYLWVNGPSGNAVKQWYDGAKVCGTSTCSVTPSTNLSSGNHTWWIQTWNPAGFGPWSSEMSFTVSP